MKRTRRNVLCALIALAAVVATMQRSKHRPPILPKASRELEFCAQHRMSSNRAVAREPYYSVSPEIFDRTTGEAGFHAHL